METLEYLENDTSDYKREKIVASIVPKLPSYMLNSEKYSFKLHKKLQLVIKKIEVAILAYTGSDVIKGNISIFVLGPSVIDWRKPHFDNLIVSEYRALQEKMSAAILAYTGSDVIKENISIFVLGPNVIDWRKSHFDNFNSF